MSVSREPCALLNEVLLRIQFVCAFKLKMVAYNCLFYHWLTSVYAASPETFEMCLFPRSIATATATSSSEQGSVVGKIHSQFAVYFELNQHIGKKCRSRWLRSLRHELSSPAQTLGSWVRIALEA
jgi:hypothetical protein